MAAGFPGGRSAESGQDLRDGRMFHKTNFTNYKSVDPLVYTVSLNGRKALNLEEKRKFGGSYNSLLQTSFLDKYRCYNLKEEMWQSGHTAFTTAFPRGFALEVMQVYSAPPKIVYKFRHWGFMEGPFKEHAPTGEMVELFGMAVFQLDDRKKIAKVEFLYNRGELLGGLLKGNEIAEAPSCLFLN